MCENLWEYYEFTQDRDVLKQIYPIMRDLAKFYQSIMVEDPTSGELVVVPSISCEHSGFGIGATFEMALSYWLMQTVIEEGEILDVDEEFRAELARRNKVRSDSYAIEERRLSRLKRRGAVCLFPRPFGARRTLAI